MGKEGVRLCDQFEGSEEVSSISQSFPPESLSFLNFFFHGLEKYLIKEIVGEKAGYKTIFGFIYGTCLPHTYLPTYLFNLSLICLLGEML